MTMELLSWSQAFGSNVDQCGGKGWNLARLDHAGFQIPHGGVITRALYDHLIRLPAIELLLQQIKQQPVTADNQLLIELKKAWLAALLPKSFKDALQLFLEQISLSDVAVSVRSSINLEDGTSASFAGIHETALNVIGQVDIEQSILKCFASLWSQRAISYRRKMNIGDDEVAAAVVICKMVNAASAGVAFSCDPASGRRDVITINANYGLGESVVSGAVEPDQYRLNRFDKQLIDQQIGLKQQQCQSKSSGGVEWLKNSSPSVACLSLPQQQQLARLCDRVFHALGEGEVHQDIEWAFDGDRFVLLQARPVTTLKELVCAEISDQPDVWSNGNFRDAIPMVLPRLMNEFCDDHINRIMHCSFEGVYPLDPALRFGRQFQGRFYCHTSLLQWIWFDFVGFPPEAFNISLGGHQPAMKIAPQQQKGLMKKLKRTWRGLKFFKQLTESRKKADTIIEEYSAFSKQQYEVDLQRLSDVQLLELAHQQYQTLTQYNHPFIMLTSQSGALMMLSQTLEKYVGDRGYSLANELMAGQANITSANHGYQLQQMALRLSDEPDVMALVCDANFQAIEWCNLLPDGSTFKQAFTQFIDEYGHRSVYEIDLSRPRWRDDPSYLFECINVYLKASSSENRQHKKSLNSDDAWQTVRQQVPRYMHGQVKKQLAAAIVGAELKEQSKSTYVQLIESFRKRYVEIGQRLVARHLMGEVEDVFHCTNCELESILLNEWDGQTLKTLIKGRKQIKAQQECMPAVDVIIDDATQQLSATFGKVGKGLKGVSAAKGSARGTARLIRTPDDGHRLQAGDVLVAPSTDPAWTPLFLNASAIVMETGGYLSHGSIVAREYGIPAVVNVAGVFSAINDGDFLVVDGDNGVVKIES